MCALWDMVLGRKAELKNHEDNVAAIFIAEAGFSSKYRHISRTHKVNISSIRDEIMKDGVSLQHSPTDKQAADRYLHEGIGRTKAGGRIEQVKSSPVPSK